MHDQIDCTLLWLKRLLTPGLNLLHDEIATAN